MKKTYLLTAIASILAANAYAVSLDLRGQYKTESEAYESRALLGHEWSNGIGGSVEYTVNNTSAAGEGIDQALWKDTEFALTYKYKLNDTVTLIPSFLFQDTKTKGDFYKYGFQANWAFAPTWRLDGRVRYEYKQSESKDINKKLDNDSTTRTDLWLRKSFDTAVDGYYNFRWDHKLNDYQYADKSSSLYEHNFGVSYKIDKTFKPYGEIGYLPDAVKNTTGGVDDDWRIRLGVAINF
jgi:hypothetical protein